MRIDDVLFFAPGLPFSHVDVARREFPKQWVDRIEGFYLQPARDAADRHQGFAAGTLALCAIDALAFVDPGGRIKRRFLSFAQRRLRSFAKPDLALLLFEIFRNGLVHEGQIKLAAEFAFDEEETVSAAGGVWRVNPARLIDEVARSLSTLIEEPSFNDRLRQRVSENFRLEFRPSAR